MTTVYAIDFGTSNSLLAAADETGTLGFAPLESEPLPGANPAILRSLLYFPDADHLYFGQKAIQEFIAHDHTGRFIRSIKKQLPSRAFVGTFVDNRAFNLEDLIGLYLGELRQRANRHFNRDVTRVVLGRPARFAIDDADDRYAEGRLERSARNAGFREIEFFPEPVAAAFGHARSSAENRECRTILAADFGGGTSDFTIYRMERDHFDPSGVLAMGGVSVAGDALDSALMRKEISPYFGTGVQYHVPFGSNTLTMPPSLMERICHPGEISLLRKQDTMEFFRNVRQWSIGDDDREKMDRLFTLLNDQLGFPLFEKVEEAKIGLSSRERTRVRFQYPEIDIDHPVTRLGFEKDAMPALERIVESLDDTLKSAGLAPERIDEVLCTGGTAKVPWIRNELIRRFGAGRLHDLDPFLGVGHGLMERAREVAQK